MNTLSGPKRTRPHDPSGQKQGLGLLTDLYELTMAACYVENRMFERAVFSLFVRDYPPHRRYFVAAGLEDVLRYLQDLKFGDTDLAYLAKLGLFKDEFLSFLENFHFTGDVWAIPEGRIFFANEPILEVEAPLVEAQVVETFVINAVNLQAMIATKASRCFHVSEGRKLVDFSLRRTHGTDAGLKAARASFIGGFAGTSNVLAGKLYGLPVFGTMAHSFITSFSRETEAFRAFVRAFPEQAVLLVDTYDTLAGARKAAELGKEMAATGKKLLGVRLDSGDIAALSKKVRRILRRAGLSQASIFASGAFDEYKIHEVLRRGGDVDAFGVGTKMGVSSDAPYLDMAYKMVEYAGQPVLKLSPGKETLVGKKQVFRFSSLSGKMRKDVIGLRDDSLKGGEPLLREVMRSGKIVGRLPSLPDIRERFLEEFSKLDVRYKAIKREEPRFPVELSPRLCRLQARATQRITRLELGES
ncbi:MAG: nicotinate phosphoribosyltransferase [Clostridiales bacterium]|nr:nicotinate phosphoribosyltransferase [Clostridiales bacterium]